MNATAIVSHGLVPSSEVVTVTINGNAWTIIQRYGCAAFNSSSRLLGSGTATDAVGMTCNLLDSQVQYSTTNSASALFSRFLEFFGAPSSPAVVIANQKIQEIGSSTTAKLLELPTTVTSSASSTLVALSQKTDELRTMTSGGLWDLSTVLKKNIIGISDVASTNPAVIAASQTVQEVSTTAATRLWDLSAAFTKNVAGAIGEAGPNIAMAGGELITGSFCKLVERKMACQIPGHVRIALKVGTVITIGYMTGTSVVPYATGRALSIYLPKIIKGAFQSL